MNNRCTELQQNKSQIHSNGLFDNNYYIPELVKDILKTKYWVEPTFMARQIPAYMAIFKILKRRHYVTGIQF